MRFSHPSNDFNPKWRQGVSRTRRQPVRAVTAPAVLEADTADSRYLATRTKLVVGGVTYLAGQQVHAAPAELARLRANGSVWRVEPSGIDWWAAEKRVLAVEPCNDLPYRMEQTEGALRIAMGCAYDPGNAGYRFASAVNEHTKHAAAFLAWREQGGNPFRCPQQYDAMQDQETARRLIYEADVLHSHAEFYLSGMSGLGVRPRAGQIAIKHYHGSLPTGVQHPIRNAEHDDVYAAIVVAARLTLCALRPGRIHWLPITVPVDRYAAMVQRKPGKALRVAHSATKDEYKGTKDLIQVVDRLKTKGVPIELVLIGYKRRGRSLEPSRRVHAEALKLKAACDITVDSLHWLGLQGSGLEAGAMGQPAIAGDDAVAELYREHVGEVPWTHLAGATADERRRALAETLERMAVDLEYRQQEAARLHAYVRRYHDYPAVARIYESILVAETGHVDLATHPLNDLPKLPPIEPMRLPPVRRSA